VIVLVILALVLITWLLGEGGLIGTWGVGYHYRR
jgi:hypothetical protein